MSTSPLLYKPTGAALEYCPGPTLALNPYEGDCPHACGYCYANAMNKRFGRSFPMRPKENLLERLDAEAAKREKSGFPGRVHLSFTGDVYAAGFESTTREVLQILNTHGLPWQVLTKRPSAALADLDLYSERCWLGATITGRTDEGGDSTAERVRALTSAWGVVRTWVSAEPLRTEQEHLEYVAQAGLRDFVAFGVERECPEATWVAQDIQRLMAGRPEGWYLKKSLRGPLSAADLPGPYEGNLLSCGWVER